MVDGCTLDIVVDQYCFQVEVVVGRCEVSELVERVSPVYCSAYKSPFIFLLLAYSCIILRLGLLLFDLIEDSQLQIVSFYLLIQNTVNF